MEQEQKLETEGQSVRGRWGESNPYQESADGKRETKKLRELLMEDFNMFLLNNILMSVQFFENYERDMTRVRERCLDETILDPNQLAIFEADSLHRLVSSKVTFQKTYGASKKGPVEQLHPLRTYVIYKNIELVTNSSSGSRKILPTPALHKLTVQRCEDEKEAAGYVNLVEIKPQEGAEIGPKTFIYHPDDDENADDRRRIPASVFVSKNDNFYVLDPIRRSKPYPVRTYRTRERITSPSFIPKSCFKENETQIIPNVKRRAGVLSQNRRKFRHLLISAAFKRHFTEVFISHLSARMKFNKVNWDGVTVHYDRIKLSKNAAQHHVIPVLELQEWPEEATPFRDDEIKTKKWIEWPTKEMQRVMKRSGCSLLPSGYHEAGDQAVDYTLEWKIDFPKAEEYLMTHMMHTHVRCYLFALTLYKTYIETELSSIHFGPSHLSNLLFFMVRKNFAGWPEYSQGETLEKFLRVLHKILQGKRMKSFFLHKRNLLADTPLRVLHKAQTVVMRILQNPVPYTLKALMNLKHRDNFYPTLDYLKLYNILTVTDLKEYLNPTVPKKGRKNKKVKPVNVVRDTVDEEELLQTKNTAPIREEVLRLFIHHFIDIANHCKQYEAYEFSMLYLTHARRLTVILSEEFASRVEIGEFMDRISRAMSNSGMPRIPKVINGEAGDNYL